MTHIYVQAKGSAKFINMPPPSTPIPEQHASVTKQLLPYSASFQEKVKLPYSPSFAELQQNQQSMLSFSNEYNTDFDPMANLYYGSFKAQMGSFKSFVDSPSPVTPQQFQPLSTTHSLHSGQPYINGYNNEYASNYENYGGEYQPGLQKGSYDSTGQNGYDYEQALSGGYCTPNKQTYDSTYGHINVPDESGEYYGQQQSYKQQYPQAQHDENPYWKWDENAGWVPKETCNSEYLNESATTIAQVPRMNSGINRLAYGVTRKKSSSSKKSRTESARFGGDIPDFEEQAKKSSSPNILGLAFGGNSGSVKSTPDRISERISEVNSPRSSLKDKKMSLWG